MKRMYVMNIKYVFVVLLTLLLMTGCWDLEEIEDLSLVSAIAFDLGENKNYKITAQILLPEILQAGAAGSEGGGQSATFVLSAEGQTVFEANRKLNEYLSKRPFYGNTQAVIIGEELAMDGILQVLIMLEKDHELRRNNKLFMSVGTADKVLDTESAILKNPTNIPIGFQKTLPKIATTVLQNVGDFISEAASTTIEPIIPVLNIIESEPETGDKPGFRIARTAAFKGDKMVGYLDEKESRGLLWVLGQIENAVIDFKVSETNNFVNIEITRENSDVKAFINKAGELEIKIGIQAEGNLTDQTGFININDCETRRRLEKILAETIRNEIKAVLNKAQRELKTDIFGFGGVVFRTFPRWWRDELEPIWYDIYPFTPVSIDVEAHIRRTGLTITAPTMGRN